MCQSHMEAPAVAGTTVGTKTREEIGALWCGVLDLGENIRMVLVEDPGLGMGLWLVLALTKGRVGLPKGAGRVVSIMTEERFMAEM